MHSLPSPLALLLLGLSACNQSRGTDTSKVAVGHLADSGTLADSATGNPPITDSGAQRTLSEMNSEVAQSQLGGALEALLSEEFVEAACRAVAVSTSQGQDGGVGACEEAVADCRQLSSLLPDAGVQLPTGGLLSDAEDLDLEELAGCPVTVDQVSRCVQQLTSVVIDQLESISCESPEAPPLNLQAVTGAPACLLVGLRCPELLTGLLGGDGDGGPPTGLSF